MSIADSIIITGAIIGIIAAIFAAIVIIWTFHLIRQEERKWKKHLPDESRRANPSIISKNF